MARQKYPPQATAACANVTLTGMQRIDAVTPFSHPRHLLGRPLRERNVI
jgi:hypothetical protein